MTLAVLSTHPIQYHAPVFRYLQANLGISTTVIYGSDFSVAGYHDSEFRAEFAWDIDLLDGYSSVFLSRVTAGGAESYSNVSARGSLGRLRAIKPDVVLLLGYSTQFHIGSFLAARNLRLPMIFRGETTDIAKARSRAKQIVRDLTLRAFYSQMNRLLYIGDASLRHFRRLGCPEDKLVFSPYCVDTTQFCLSNEDHSQLRNSGRERMVIPMNAFVLLFSGKLVLRKGPDLLIEAFLRLQADRPNESFHLIFLGDGELRPHLEEVASGQDNVHFAGFQNQSRLSEYYHMSDLLVMPSRFGETWGLVVNEAMLHGLPCVVSDQVGSSKDLIDPGETGEVFESDSVESLVAAIERSLNLTLQPQVSDKCRAKVSNYSVEQAAFGIAKAYEQILHLRADV